MSLHLQSIFFLSPPPLFFLSFSLSFFLFSLSQTHSLSFLLSLCFSLSLLILLCSTKILAQELPFSFLFVCLSLSLSLSLLVYFIKEIALTPSQAGRDTAQTRNHEHRVRVRLPRRKEKEGHDF